MPARGPSRPLLVGYRVAALALGPPLHGAEVVSGPAQLGVPTPRHLGVLEQWR